MPCQKAECTHFVSGFNIDNTEFCSIRNSECIRSGIVSQRQKQSFTNDVCADVIGQYCSLFLRRRRSIFIVCNDFEVLFNIIIRVCQSFGRGKRIKTLLAQNINKHKNLSPSCEWGGINTAVSIFCTRIDSTPGVKLEQ